MKLNQSLFFRNTHNYQCVIFHKFDKKMTQLAQLSERDRATAAWVKFGQKWKRIFRRHFLQPLWR